MLKICLTSKVKVKNPCLKWFSGSGVTKVMSTLIVFLFIYIPEDPAYSTPDGSHFFFFSGRYVRGTMCNCVFFFNFFGSIFPHIRPDHRPKKIFIFFSKKFDISTFWIFFFENAQNHKFKRKFVRFQVDRFPIGLK